MSPSLSVAIERVFEGGRVPQSGLKRTLSDTGVKVVLEVQVHKGGRSFGLPKRGCVDICDTAFSVHALSST